MQEHEVDEMLHRELRRLMPNIIWQNEQGQYEVFGLYTICPKRWGYEVWTRSDCVGKFRKTRSALAYCIADKFRKYNLAREIKTVENLLDNLSNDIFVRAGVASKCRREQSKEDIETKLESKIVRKRELEMQLEKCINLAKYYQQRGFNNETARTGRASANKTSR